MTWTMYALGSNGSGQLGIGHLEDVAEPTVCQFAGDKPEATPVTIAAGGNHTLVLFEDGSAYAAGDVPGGLCSGNEMLEAGGATKFRRISFSDDGVIDRFTHIACTWNAVVMVSDRHGVYTAGSGPWGELGQGENITSLERPTKIDGFLRKDVSIVALAACMAHAVAVLSDGSVYGWGNGRKGQLGESNSIAWQPRLLPEVAHETQRALCTRETSVMLGDTCLSVLGSEKWSIKADKPDPVPSWESAGANWGTISLLLQTGSVLSWGRDDHCQHAPTETPVLSKIVCGSEHTVAQTQDGRIIAWGWGEHGNCGMPLNSKKDTETFNVLADDPSNAVLGAGCATSFILRTS